MKNRFLRISAYLLASLAITFAVSFAQAGDSTSFNPTAVTVKVESIGGVPIGGVIPWPSATPPKNYLECNGQAFSSTQYPQLAAQLDKTTVPNMTGTFLRGSGDGRAVNSTSPAKAGVTLTRQTQVTNGDSGFSGRNTTISTSEGWSAWGVQAGKGNSHESVGYGGESHSSWTQGRVRFHIAANSNGGPKNYAVMYIIRAK